jgi:dUTP pyrophosphatase
MKLRTKIKKLRDVPTPTYAKPNDAGFDLTAANDVIIEPGETKIIPTGLAFDIPPGYEMQIRPRSGISAKTKLRVVLGTVDADYRGEVGVIVDNTTWTDREYYRSKIIKDLDGRIVGESDVFQSGQSILIRKGDRIAQAVIAQVEHAHFVVVDELSESERGDGGFGHSGLTTDDIRKKHSLEAD